MRNKKVDDFMAKIQWLLFNIGLDFLGNKMQDFRLKYTMVR